MESTSAGVLFGFRTVSVWGVKGKYMGLIVGGFENNRHSPNVFTQNVVIGNRLGEIKDFYRYDPRAVRLR